MAKKCWTLSYDEYDLDKKISILETSRQYVNYIPNLILLGKFHSIRSKIKHLKNDPEYNLEKRQAEEFFRNAASIIREIKPKNKEMWGIYKHNIHNHNIFYEWGEHYRLWEEYKDAISGYEISIQEIEKYQRFINDTDEKVRIKCILFIGMCYSELGQFEKAKKIFDDVQRNHNAHHPYLFTGLGELFLHISMSDGIAKNIKNKKLNEAKSFFKRAIDYQPDNYYPYWYLSKVFVEEKNIKEAYSFLIAAEKKVATSDNIINKFKIQNELQQIKIKSGDIFGNNILIDDAGSYQQKKYPHTPSISPPVTDPPEKIDWLSIIKMGENKNIELKQSLRWSCFLKDDKKKSEYIAMRAVVSLLNSDGGYLFIGVEDNGDVIGIEDDYKTLQRKNSDGFLIHFDNLINNYIGKEFHQYLKIFVEPIDGKEICIVQAKPSNSPTFLLSKDNNGNEREEFFIRGAGASSHQLGQKETIEYIKAHWKERS